MDVIKNKTKNKINFISAINIMFSKKLLCNKYLHENNILYGSNLRIEQIDIIEKWIIVDKKELN